MNDHELADVYSIPEQVLPDLPGVPYYSLLMDAWFSIFTKKLPDAMEFAQFKGEKRQQGNTLFDKRRPFSYSGGCNLVVPAGWRSEVTSKSDERAGIVIDHKKRPLSSLVQKKSLFS